jgi:hypothetical protein
LGSSYFGTLVKRRRCFLGLSPELPMRCSLAQMAGAQRDACRPAAYGAHGWSTECQAREGSSFRAFRGVNVWS